MIFALFIIFMTGLWAGLYIADMLGPSKKVKKKVIDDLNNVLKDNWKHCRDEIRAAIKFIEKHT